MPIGMRCYDASGDVVFDTESKVSRLVYKNEVSANSSSNVTVDAIDGENIAIVTYSTDNSTFGAGNYSQGTHIVTRSGTTITWTARNNATHCPSVDTMILIFLYE